MSVFSVESGDGVISVTWEQGMDETTGELLVNNLTLDTYQIIPLLADNKGSSASDVELRDGAYDVKNVVNGHLYTVRLITYKKVNRVKTIVRCTDEIETMATSVPQPLVVELKSANQAIVVVLEDGITGAALNSKNGFSEILNFEVLIDAGNGDDELQIYGDDELQIYDKSQVSNNQLFLKTMQINSDRTPKLDGVRLVNGKDYKISIRAVNANGGSAFTAKALVKPKLLAPNVTGFGAVPSDGKVTLSWSAADLNVLLSETDLKPSVKYLISYGTTNIEVNYLDGVNDRTSYEVISLNNGTSYDFSIRTDCGSLYGTTPEEEAKTLSDVVPFGAPDALVEADVTISERVNIGLRFRVTPPYNNGKAITSYNCFIGVDTSNNYAQSGAMVNGKFVFDVTGLSPGVENTFNLSALNSLEGEKLSVTHTYYTTPSPVTDLKVTSSSADGSVTVSWVEPSELADRGGSSLDSLKHRIKYFEATPVDGPQLAMQPVNAGNLNEWKFTNLVKGRAYMFSVQSYFTGNDVVYESVYTAPITCVPNKLPVAPSPSVVRASDKEKMSISWTQPELYGLVLSKYQYKVDYQVNMATVSGVWVDVSAAEAAALKVEYMPPVFGNQYSIYMKTFTTLPESDDENDVSELESVASEAITYTAYKPPTLIQNLTLEPKQNAIEVTWSHPSDYGGYTSEQLFYYVYVNNIEPPTVVSSGVTLKRTFAGLSNELTYISVKAVGRIVAGVDNDSSGLLGNSALPLFDPVAPTGLQAVAGDKQVKLKWIESVSYNPVAQGATAPAISYEIHRSVDEGVNYTKICGSIQGGATLLEYTDSGRVNALLVNGNEYRYKVVTKLVRGNVTIYSANKDNDEATYVSAFPWEYLSEVKNLDLSYESGAIYAEWEAPANLGDSGLEVPQYIVEVLDNGPNDAKTEPVSILLTLPQSELNKEILGLVNGNNYTVKVFSQGKDKNSVPVYRKNEAVFASKDAIPNLAPLPPVSPIAVADDTKITLSWSAPVADAYVTDHYKLYLNNVLQLVTVAANVYSYEFAGLTNALSYSVGVRRVTNVPVVSESSRETVSGLVPYGAPIIVSAELESDKRQVKLTVNPNGSIVNNMLVVATEQAPNNGSTLMDIQVPIAPANIQSVINSNISITTSQLRVSSNIAYAFVLFGNEGGKAVQMKYSFNSSGVGNVVV